MIPMRIIMATVMAVLVPLWCCCAAMGHAAAQEAEALARGAGHGCCDTTREAPSPAPEKPDEKQSCECGDEEPPPPVIGQKVSPPGLELLQSLLAFTPTPLILDAQATVCPAGPGAEASTPPPSNPSLHAQHILLLI